MADDVGARDGEGLEHDPLEQRERHVWRQGQPRRVERRHVGAQRVHLAAVEQSVRRRRRSEAGRQVGERAAESGDEQDAALLQLGERELVPLQRRRRAHDQRPAADA